MQAVQLERKLRLGLFGCLGLTMAWLVTSRSLVSYLAVASPSTARLINATDARTLLSRAEHELDARAAKAQSEKTTTSLNASQFNSKLVANTPPRVPLATDVDVKSWLEIALVHDPMNARAIALRAQLAADSNEDHAEALMQLAVARSRHESQSIQRLLSKAYEAKDDANIVTYVDLLMRTRPVAREALVPYLTAVAERQSGRPELIRVLSENPAWRKDFFRYVPNSVTNANTPLQLLLELKVTSNPPTQHEIKPYLDFLLSKKFYELAYFTWLQFLTPDQMAEAGSIYNGSFESPSYDMPFDWAIESGSNVTTEIRPRPDAPEKHALYIEFAQGRVQFQPVGQMVLLAPGRYTLKGQYRGEINGRRGLVWRATCADGEQEQFGESTMLVGAAPSWREFQFSFEVPDRTQASRRNEGLPCRGQRLRIEHAARSASEQLLSGAVWFDELVLRRD